MIVNLLPTQKMTKITAKSLAIFFVPVSFAAISGGACIVPTMVIKILVHNVKGVQRLYPIPIERT